MKKITEIAEDAGIPEDCLELYGNYKAKINYGLLASETAEKLNFLD